MTDYYIFRFNIYMINDVHKGRSGGVSEPVVCLRRWTSGESNNNNKKRNKCSHRMTLPLIIQRTGMIESNFISYALSEKVIFFHSLAEAQKCHCFDSIHFYFFFHKSLHVNSSFDTTLFPRYGRSIIHLFALTSIKIQIHVSTEMCNCTKWVWDSLWNGIANKAVFTFNPSWNFF